MNTAKSISRFRWFNSIAILLFCCSKLAANHIVGGNMTYSPNATQPGTWDFEITVFRNCSSGGAQFDDPIGIGIYRKLDSLTYELFADFSVELAQTTLIDLQNLPCGSPAPAFCFENGVYRFSSPIPADNFTYIVEYQRCCRNAAVINLIQPEDVGITLFVELSPLARALGNSSPRFGSIASSFFGCLHQAGEIKFEVVDPDVSDSLVVAFCPIISGGGKAGSNCESPKPAPPCPPPFSTVAFSDTTYSFSKPLGQWGTSEIAQNPPRWLVTPKRLGLFGYAICASEFRNGQFLGSVRQEFQLLVVDAPVSTNEVSALPDFQISPNPAHDFFEIGLHNFPSENLTIRISNLAGKICMEKIVKGGSCQKITTAGLPAGLLNLEILTDGQRTTRQFVVLK